MIRRISAATGATLAASLLLGGCFLLSGSEPSGSLCPELAPEHFGVDNAVVADPYEIAESVGLEDVLEGTCAYGFETDRFDGVGFHLVNPSEEALEAFFDRAERALLDAEFEDFRPLPSGIVKQNPDGVVYLVSYDEEFGPSDGMTAEQFENMGLVEGESLLYGAINVPRTR
jgi:hypothetical protein